MARGELPKYRSIADDLERRIASCEFAAGDQLPAQSALAAEYGVTVMTLRQALAELERDGLVSAARGKGTYVREPTAVSFGLDRLSSFAQEMAQQGVAVETEVLGVDEPAGVDDAAVARAAAGPDHWADDALVTVLRRRSIAGSPVVVQRSTMTATSWSAIAGVDLRTTSLYAALDTAGHRVARASESFRAVLVTGSDAERLGVSDRTAALESTRVSYDGDLPFLVDRALMLGSATEVRAERTADDLRLGYGTP